MKLFLILLFIIPVLFSCTSNANLAQENRLEDQNNSQDITKNWVDFESEDGRFRIKMPGIPTKETTKEVTDVGEILVELFLYEESATVAYIIGYNDYPSALFENATDVLYKEMLLGGVEGFTENVGLDIIETSNDISLGKAKGIAVRAKSSTNSFYVHYRAYIISNRLYQIGILRDGSYPAKDKSDAFFGSFQLM